MKNLTWLLPLLVATIPVSAQKKVDRKTLSNLQTHVNYLSSDKLEGRRTGAPGEQLAAAYISSQMQQIGLSPKGDEGFLQTFTVNETRVPAANCAMTLNHQALSPGAQFIPLPFSATKTMKGEVIPNVNEPDNIWLVNIQEIDNTKGKTKWQLYQQETLTAAKAGATGVIFYNGKESIAEVNDWLAQNPTPASIPAVWVNNEVSKKLGNDDANGFQITCQVAFQPMKRTGTNVIGYINNNAAATIVIGAHYDHLGFGEDHNGLGGEKVLYHGANDNASGIAAMLEIARQLKGSRLHNNNYLFVAFSGNEQGLSGSRHFVAGSDVAAVNYMINLDMIGRLDAANGLHISGVGTSPGWAAVLKEVSARETKLVLDSGASGPYDHTSFYKKNIPVLFFFTSNADYHLPGDSADKINYDGTLTVMKVIYDIIDKTNSMGKLAFSNTREPQTAALK
ncbi:M28 family peptidase [Chitinophaga vietnamensis]|uniref:M28 family peptidase n=1 Tax=Chitinophaga vietnamensis TaxID=2593957 RepID=UPI001178B483|nr:M28 family peptidase [Chitinophaga vietnamensis]